MTSKTTTPQDSATATSTTAPAPAPNFIRHIIDEDNQTGKHGGKVATRFPPEPNGYLHIGHAKSICLNFGLARDYRGLCNLRFDDTNPAKEDIEYVHAIEADIQWLGFQWSGKYFASDYFGKIYDYAVELIKLGKAYVEDLNAEQMREYRGTLTEPGRNSPYRDRTISENLDLFARMRQGEFADGAKVLRAKIDMASPNINLRDPALYRIRRAHHHRTGDEWCIYPMYDYAHPVSDMIEGITHSICTLEFEDHRPFYDWVLAAIRDSGALGPKPAQAPQQIEFSKLKLDHVVLSKRNLLRLVQEKHVNGWDDPRMPTIRGFRRRGFTAPAIRELCERVGVTKKNALTEMSALENCVREDLDKRAPRSMAVLRPLKLVIENYPEGQVEEFDVPNHPANPEMGTRKVKFAKTLFIEQDDFMEDPPKGFFRLGPGREVRLRSAYFVKCESFTRDASGRVTEIRCTYDPATRGGNAPDGRKVKGTLHWLSAEHSVLAEIRLVDRLFTVPFPGTGDTDFITQMNPDALITLSESRVEPGAAQAKPETHFQFERQGYFCADWRDHEPGKRVVFNRAVTLRDSWAAGAAGTGSGQAAAAGKGTAVPQGNSKKPS